MNLYNCHTHQCMNPGQEIFCSDLTPILTKPHSIGIHPWKADGLSVKEIDRILVAMLNNHTVALGEIGLDRLHGPDIQLQKSVFAHQIEFSERQNLPVILHCVKAWSDILQIRKQRQPKQIWIYHGFSKANILQEIVEEGIVVSIGADILTHKKLQEVLPLIPNENLLLETDDRSIDIQLIYTKVAELKEISLVLLSEIIEQNCKRIFPKWQIG